MTNLFRFLPFFALPLLSTPALAQESIATVNGVAIPVTHAEVVRQDRAARGLPTGPESDESIRDALVNLELLAQAARNKGLDKAPYVQALLELQRKETLARLLQEDFFRTARIPEERLRAEYEKAKAQAGEAEYRVRHILVDDEKLARSLIADITGRKRAKFEDLARQHSKDSSAQNGGDLGWLTPNGLVPEFAEAMLKLKKGELSRAPVKSRFGWHIIRVDDVRKLEFPPYEDVRDRIAQQLLQIEYRKYIAALRSDARIDLPKR